MTADDNSTHEPTGLWWWIRTTVSWSLLLGMLALLVLVILVPAIAGAERFTVLTGSMKPTYPPGTLIVVKPVEAKELRIGLPITYQLQTGQSAVVTHRIVSTTQNAKGERAFVTRGDANDSPDAKPVVAEQVRGEVWYSVPYLGYVNNWLTGQQRAWTIGVLVIGLFSYAMFMTAGALRDGRRARHKKLDNDGPDTLPSDSARTGQHSSVHQGDLTPNPISSSDERLQVEEAEK
ncbi:signal peptidase I [Williamsia muralis]|uniref:Signal peptidase I n=1 Tax=Williamsia marianensis TaxID=85044 RepID=A0A315SHN9_WILMA|nr:MULTISPECIES: signal peptidase I [Williamsia]PVY30491.1 signal peptidase [Williamsia marianensis]RKR93536.1 signal peptidase [Williamsia muralis]